MAEKLNFNELVNTKAGDVKPPVPLPTGHYDAVLTGPFTPHQARSGNVAMRFPIKLVAPGDDVDQEQLHEIGGIPDKTYTLDFWMSSDAQYRFVNFCNSCGITDENLTLSEMAEALVEAQPTFTVEVKQETDKDDPEKVYTRIDNPVGQAG